MTVEPDVMPPKSRSRRASLSGNTLSVSLKILGFSSWKDLEPGRYEELVFIRQSHLEMIFILLYTQNRNKIIYLSFSKLQTR